MQIKCTWWQIRTLYVRHRYIFTRNVMYKTLSTWIPLNWIWFLVNLYALLHCFIANGRISHQQIKFQIDDQIWLQKIVLDFIMHYFFKIFQYFLSLISRKFKWHIYCIQNLFTFFIAFLNDNGTFTSIFCHSSSFIVNI